jgi:hypothetical protein
MPGKDGYPTAALRLLRVPGHGFHRQRLRERDDARPAAGARLQGRPELPRHLGPVRQLRLHLAADLPHLEHRAVAGHHRAVAPRQLGGAGHGDGGPGLCGRRHDQQHRGRRRPRLPLRRGAAGLAGGARDLRDRSSLDLTAREYFVSDVAATAAATTTSPAPTSPIPGASRTSTRSRQVPVEPARCQLSRHRRPRPVARHLRHLLHLLGHDRFGAVDWK